jgi:hypothetical protein
VGMINVDMYITALQASWFKKMNGKYGDNWRRDIKKVTGGEPIISKAELYIDIAALVLCEISNSLNSVQKGFYETNNNLLCSNIILNPVIEKFERQTSVLTILKNNALRLTLPEMAGLKVAQFWDPGGGMKRLDDICETTGLNISLITYMRLGEILMPACRKLSPEPKPENISITMAGNIKGSKKFVTYCMAHTLGRKNSI